MTGIQQDLAAIIASKTRRPAVPSTYFPRERLMGCLTAWRDCPLILISSPAGSGKTTLLSAWLATLDWPVAWVSLDADDNALYSFVRHVVAALQEQFPGALTRTASVLRSFALPDGSALASMLVNDLGRIGEPFVLALDDYHEIEQPAVHDLIGRLVRHLPHGAHLALATRQDPPLPMSALRARGQIAEIRMEDMRFTDEESATLLRQVAGKDLSPSSVALMAEQLDGWAAGLVLAALTLRHDPGTLMLAPRSLSANHDTSRYLFEEVLTRQPAPVQEYLLSTSILDELSGPLCDAVAGQSDLTHNGELGLDVIAKRNLFVTRVDAEGRSYRYHHLFRQLLQEELKRRHGPDEIRALYGRASDWYARNGHLDEAVSYALRSGNLARVTQLISQNRRQLINDDHILQLSHWLDQVPRDAIDASPELLVTMAWLAQVRYSGAEIPGLLAQADAILSALEPTPDRDALRGEMAALWSFLLFTSGDLAACRTAAQQALRLAPDGHWQAISIGWLLTCMTQLIAGDRVGAFTRAYSALAEGRDRSDGLAMRLLTALSFLHSYAGDLSAQQRVSSEVLRIGAGHAERYRYHNNWARHHLGIAHYFRNDLAAAEEALSLVVAQRYECYVNCAVQSMFALALTYQAQGRQNAASEMAQLAANYALEVRCAAMTPQIEVFGAQLALQQGRVADAAHGLANWTLPEIPAPLPFFFIPPLSFAKVSLALGTPAALVEAEAQLARLHKQAERQHNARLLMEVLALEALLSEARHDQRAALSTLEQALVLAQPEGYLRLFADLGPRMADLLGRVHSRNVAPAFIQRILGAMSAPQSPGSAPSQIALIEPLTDRELEVLALLQRRMSNKEIAASLYIAPGTVKRHVHAIFEKLDASSRRDAVLRAMDLNLLEPA